MDVQKPTSIETTEQEGKIIYPIPTDGMIYYGISLKDTEIMILNLHGQIVLRKKVD